MSLKKNVTVPVGTSLMRGRVRRRRKTTYTSVCVDLTRPEGEGLAFVPEGCFHQKMSSDPTTVGRGPRRGRRSWLVAAILIVAILVAAAFAWGFAGGGQSESETAEVLEQFRDAINAGDYETACSLLASTAPPRAAGASRCPSRLRTRKNMVAEWGYILPGELETEVERRDGGRVRVIARPESDTLFDAGPVYRFTFVDENGNLRLEHFLGRF